MLHQLECLGCGLVAPLPCHDDELDRLPGRRLTILAKLSADDWYFSPTLCPSCNVLYDRQAALVTTPAVLAQHEEARAEAMRARMAKARAARKPKGVQE